MTSPTSALRFPPPTGFDDLTDYTFQAPDGPQRLTIHTAPAPPPPETALAGYLTQLGRMFKGAAVIDWVGPCPDLAPSALELCFRFSEGGALLRQRCGWVRLDRAGQQLGVFVESVDRSTGSSDDGAFGLIVRSIRMVGEPPPSDPPGFTRRPAGPVTLAVPSGLGSPTAYLFATPSADIRLSAHLGRPGTPPVAAAYGAGGAAPPETRVEQVGTYAAGLMTMYKRTRPRSGRDPADRKVVDYVCHGVTTLADGTPVTLSGLCHWDQAPAGASANTGRRQRMIEGFETLAAVVRTGGG